ncbi:molybdenum cofactor guanylyltransferase [Candidatus Pelagibacter sp.]|jgi:molybdopterin-guanine dinucleotide biosynthesis protein A|nr:molybdenum cofactor guanylyltransferase [Candidatus Pelagibacter sp.]|tara:strand:+ start:15 stop:626 length:612 start_codon:yes stop_codon:yes gene_type:complete
MEDNNILAVVLAGGKSKRFGEDKNHIKLGDKTLLEHVLSKISNKFKEILIVSSHTLEIQKINNVTVIPDCFDDLGPLAGVLSSMRWVKENKKSYQWIATFPSDTPFFETSIIEEYKKRIKLSESLLYFVKSNNKRHNIFGLWSIDLIKILENDLIENNFRKVEQWANKIGVETIDIEIKKFDPFFNINTKKDFEEAKKILREN